ncbi:MAG: hypothetical protein M3065_01210 [Actinomycetota bacterium]|nr:hypothetical protein [Actinomycetota bacterium]
MTAWHHYSELQASIETETDWTGDHVTGSFVIVSMTDERCRLDTAVCQLTIAETRRIAIELLQVAESAEHETRRSDER